MIDINAKDRGKAAANADKIRQPMNDSRFVKLMYAAIEDYDGTAREAKAAYVSEWKSGWDEAKAETEVQARPTKKKAKKKKRVRIIRKRAKK
jgi:hypothetical protein